MKCLGQPAGTWKKLVAMNWNRAVEALLFGLPVDSEGHSRALGSFLKAKLGSVWAGTLAKLGCTPGPGLGLLSRSQECELQRSQLSFPLNMEPNRLR